MLPRGGHHEHHPFHTGATEPLHRATSVSTSPFKAFLISPEAEENHLSSSRAGRCPAELEPEQRLAAQRGLPPPCVRDLGLLFGQLQCQISSRCLRVTSYLPPDLREDVSSRSVLVFMVFKVQMAFSREENPLSRNLWCLCVSRGSGPLCTETQSPAAVERWEHTHFQRLPCMLPSLGGCWGVVQPCLGGEV